MGIGDKISAALVLTAALALVVLLLLYLSADSQRFRAAMLWEQSLPEREEWFRLALALSPERTAENDRSAASLPPEQCAEAAIRLSRLVNSRRDEAPAGDFLAYREASQALASRIASYNRSAEHLNALLEAPLAGRVFSLLGFRPSQVFRLENMPPQKAAGKG